MNKAQKEVIQAQLNAEKKVIRELKQVYGQALKDVEENLRKLYQNGIMRILMLFSRIV